MKDKDVEELVRVIFPRTIKVETVDGQTVELTLDDLEILSTIILLGEATIYDLAKIFHAPPGTISNRLNKLVRLGFLNEPTEIVSGGRLKKLYRVRQFIQLPAEDKEALFKKICRQVFSPQRLLSEYHNRKLIDVLRTEPSKFHLLQMLASGFLELDGDIIKVPERSIKCVEKTLVDMLRQVVDMCVKNLGEKRTIEALEDILNNLKQSS